jgi:hypothetical protein
VGTASANKDQKEWLKEQNDNFYNLNAYSIYHPNISSIERLKEASSTCGFFDAQLISWTILTGHCLYHLSS